MCARVGGGSIFMCVCACFCVFVYAREREREREKEKERERERVCARVCVLAHAEEVEVCPSSLWKNSVCLCVYVCDKTKESACV